MDTTPLEHDLLQHRDFLLRLAAGLVGRDDAEDLAQDVWARAVAHPGGGPAWLARVARNLAVNRFRARARRERRERDHALPEAAPGALGELDERFELGQRVAAAVQALEEPYRAVILLRFFDGLSHAEIARRLELPITTVRTRQQRALARLRERLDREVGGRKAWSLALTGWLARSAIPGTTVALGGFGAALTAAVLVALVVGSAWWTVGRDGGETVVADEPLGDARSEAEPAASQPVASSRPAAPQRDPVASVPVPTSAPRTLLVGKVVGLTVEELREAHVEVDAEWKRYSIGPAPLWSALQDDGSFAVDIGTLLAFKTERPDELVAVLDHPLHLRATSRVSAPKGEPQPSGDTLFDAGELLARDAAVARGVVHLPDGTPAAGAAVMAWFLEGGVPRRDSSALVRCDDEGRYDVRLERGGECLLAFLEEGVRPASRVVSPHLGRSVELETTMLEAGHAIAGRVTRLGNPMPQARVDVIEPIGGHYIDGTGGSGIVWQDGRVEWSSRTIQADSEGRFRCSGLAPAAYSVSVYGAGDMGSLDFRRESIEATAPCADLALEFRSCLVTLDRTAESPVKAEGTIHVSGVGLEKTEFHFWQAGFRPCTTFVAPPNTALSLSVELSGGVPPIPLEIVTLGPGEELRRTVAFSAPGPRAISAPGSLATLELEWIPDPRLSLEGFGAHFESPEGGELFSRSCETRDAIDGVFRLEDVPPGRYRVHIRAGWEHLFENTLALNRVLAVELAPGATTRERFAFELGGILRLDVRAASGERCSARYRVLDAAGAPRPVTFQTRWGRDKTTSATSFLSSRGEHRSETLPAGDYTLVLWRGDLPEQHVPVRVVAGETTDVEVTLLPK